MKNRMKCIVVAIGLSVGVGGASGQSLNENLKLTASDGVENDRFGYSIAIDNGIVAVGAHHDDDLNSGSGSVYLFDAFTGGQLFKLTANDGAEHDFFGWSIAIDSGIVAVGAYLDDDQGIDSGSAYLFDASTGRQLFKLSASNGAGNDRFGSSIAIDNGIVAVGSKYKFTHTGGNSGSAYLFDASTGGQLFELSATDGAAGDLFGSSIAIDKGIVAVGVIGDSDQGEVSGSAYLFNASTGRQLFKLTASDGAGGDAFGWSIAIDNGIVAVGSVFDDDQGETSGSAYLFDASTGVELFKLIASDGAGGDRFGSSVAINDGIVAVGASRDDAQGTDLGSAYLFDVSTGMQVAKLVASDSEAQDWFGISIGIDDGMAAVGSIWNDGHAYNSGSAYVFDVTCSADLNNDLALDFFDVSDFLELFAAGDLTVDFNGDGVLNYFDISNFVIDFLQGCPLIN